MDKKSLADPLDSLINLGSDLLHSDPNKESGDKMKQYLTNNGGTTPFGTPVRYIGNDDKTKASGWAKAGEDAYNLRQNVGDSGITFDNITGKVTIKSTDRIKNSDWYKSRFSENSTFQEVARQYGANPDADTTMQMTDKDGNVETVKVKDWMESEAKAFDELAHDYGTVVLPFKDEIEKASDGRIIMSDEEAVTALSGTQRSRDQYASDKVVYIPFAAQRWGLNKLPSFNEETGTVSAKDFYEWYQVHAGSNAGSGSAAEKMQDIHELNQALADIISYALTTDDPTEADIKQLASAISMTRTLKADMPETSAVVCSALFFKSLAASTANVLNEASVNLYGFIEDVNIKTAEFLSPAKTSGKIAAAITAGGSLTVWSAAGGIATTIEAAKTGAYSIGAAVAGIDNNPNEGQSVNALYALGDLYEGIMAGNGKDTIKKWADATGVKTNEEAISIIDSYYNEGQELREQISSAAVAGRVVGKIAGEIIKQVALTNVVGGAVSSIMKNAVARLAKDAMAQYIETSYLTLESGIHVYATTAKAGDLTYAFLTGTKYIADGLGWSANIMAQGLVDTVLNDEAIINRLLNNPNEEERHAFGEALQYNIKQNIFGEISGLAIGTAGRGAGYALKKTGASAWITRQTSWLGAKKHTALARFGKWMAEGDGWIARRLNKVLKADSETSRWYRGLHWREAEALYSIHHAAKGTSSIAEATEATQKAVVRRMEIEVALGRVTRGTMRQWQRIVTDDAIRVQLKEMDDAYTDLLKSEGDAAIKRGKKDRAFLSQDTSDYIALKGRLDYLNNKERVLAEQGKSLSPDELAYRDGIRTRVTSYRDGHTAEHMKAVENYINKARTYQTAWRGYTAKSADMGGLGVYDAAEVKARVDTGFWGENGFEYLPSMRIEVGEDAVDAAAKGAEDWSKAGNYQAKLGMDEYKLKPGDIDAHYADPSLVIYAQQVTAAKVTLSRDWGNVLMKNDSFAHEINTNGEAITKSQITTARHQIHSVVKKSMNSYSVDDTILGFNFSGAYKRQTEIGLKRATSNLKNSAYNLTEADFKALEKAGINTPYIPSVRTRAQLDQFMSTLNDEQQKIVYRALGGENLTIRSFNAAKANSDMVMKLKRSFMASDSGILDSAKYQEYVANLEKVKMDTRSALKYLDNYKRYVDISEQIGLKALGKDDYSMAVQELTDGLFETASKSLDDNIFLNKMLAEYEAKGVPRDVAKRYLIAQEFHDYFGGSGGTKAFNDMLNKNLLNIKAAGNLSREMQLKLLKEIRESVQKNVESEWADSVNALKNAGGGDILDTEKIYDYIYKQMEDFIDTTLRNPNVVQVLDNDGVFHLYELSPTAATLYKERPNLATERGAFSRFFSKTNRLAKLNNVGWSIKSFWNQWMRDPLAAFIQGGFVRSLNTNADEIAEMLGPDCVQLMKAEIGEAGWKEALTDLEERLGRAATSEEIEELAKSKVRSVVTGMAEEAGFKTGKEGQEVQYYREMNKGYKDAVWNDFKAKEGLGERTLQWMERHSLGNFREQYLRKSVYANALRDAIDMGHSIPEAKIVAEYTAMNATTNFARSFSFGNNIIHSIPFFGAALNGRASFWRLFEIDPVGVSSRFINGLVLPAMGLYTMSMQSQADREVYKTIPEYEKQDNIVFVVDGEKFKIALPQELSMFLAPFRHVVEKANDANDHSWLELTTNDILQVSPLDLTGFVDLDANTLQGNPTITDRLSAEADALISQLSPTVVKTAYMAITGRDPYTGASIDKSKVYVDEFGDEQINDYKSNQFLNWLSAKCKEMGIDVSGSSIHAIFQSLVGNATTDTLDAIIKLFSGDVEGAVGAPIEETAAAFSSSSSDDPGYMKFREAIKDLEKQKDALMNDKAFTDISNKLSMLDISDPQYEKKRAGLLASYRGKIQDYQQRVFNTVENYQKQYGTGYNRNMFASVVNLLTFYKSYGENLNQVEKDANKEMYYAARNRAVATMNEYGFSSPDDNSIFGYIRTNEFGEAEHKENSPVAIMNMDSQVWGATAADSANIEALLDKYELTRKNMFGDEYNKAKKAGKKALKKYQAEWNQKVIEAIAPYIESRGADNVLKNSGTRDLLDNYVFVKNLYKTKEYLYDIFDVEE